MAARTAGFTLVEMLVALLIFALLSAVGVGVMAYAADNQGVVQARMDRLGEFQRARGLLQADLAQAAVRRVRGRDGAPARNAFVGRTDGAGRGGEPLLALVRRGWANPDGEPRASLQYIEYRIVDGQLERASRAALDGAATGTPQVLLTGIRAASIEYHHRGQWNRGWAGGAAAMPDAVRLTLELDGLGRIEQLLLLPGTAT
ncbi:type II secretion system protein J [Lysobacter arseniciresistens ZS79]|uniref:Type II secretion system protein J n=1 Tax=Lysobacter arseniciresistens ZS79 TaxID=913325 RepID=A0A0A0F2F3_9GAMM|nr:type II secretion system minor pseudopilin GspJ [Lysobacter arseniciresistens]KGM56518.1 type II secretion system protein J [Lysobacter arseniciresistens ZS79]